GQQVSVVSPGPGSRAAQVTPEAPSEQGQHRERDPWLVLQQPLEVIAADLKTVEVGPGPDPSAADGLGYQQREFADELPGSELDRVTAGVLDYDGSLKDQEHARPFLARAGQDLAGRDYAFDGDVEHTPEDLIVEACEQRHAAKRRQLVGHVRFDWRSSLGCSPRGHRPDLLASGVLLLGRLRLSTARGAVRRWLRRTMSVSLGACVSIHSSSSGVNPGS